LTSRQTPDDLLDAVFFLDEGVDGKKLFEWFTNDFKGAIDVPPPGIL
jgi:hypothetical protein